jgi:hypothetical protein
MVQKKRKGFQGVYYLATTACQQLDTICLAIGKISGFVLGVLEFLLLCDGLSRNNLGEALQAGSLQPCIELVAKNSEELDINDLQEGV